MKTIEYTNEEVLNSKQYVKNGMQFPSPLEILKPLFDAAGYDNFTLQGSHEAVIAHENIDMVAFGRVAALKTFELDEEVSYRIGFVYSFDQGKPFIKVFSGANVHACTNLCVFDASHIAKFDIFTHGYNGAYEATKQFLTDQRKNADDAFRIIQDMKAFRMNMTEVKQALGHLMIGFSASKNVAGTTCLLDGAKLITNKDSRYYVRPEENTTAWNFFNALTDTYREKVHIIDQPEKVLSLYREIKDIEKNIGYKKQLEIG